MPKTKKKISSISSLRELKAAKHGKPHQHKHQHHQRIHQISLSHLLDFLSEMLVLQKNCIQVMSLARDRANTPEMHQWLGQFVDATENRADQIRNVIRDLGGNPVFMSPAAEIQLQRAEAAVHLTVPSRLQQLTDIENCWYVSLQENVHLAFLRSILPFLDNAHAQDLLDDVLEETAHEQDDRLEWLQQTLHRLLLQRAIMPSDSHDWDRAA